MCIKITVDRSDEHRAMLQTGAFLVLLQCLFVGLNLCGLIGWPLWCVLLPVLFPVLLAIAACSMVLILILFQGTVAFLEGVLTRVDKLLGTNFFRPGIDDFWV